MIKDPAIKLKLAGNYATVANYWKFFDGETKQLIKFKTQQEKEAYEAQFTAWAKGKPAYENIFADYAGNYAAWTPYSKHRQYINEGVLGSPLATFASQLAAIENAIIKKGSTEADVKKSASDRLL